LIVCHDEGITFRNRVATGSRVSTEGTIMVAGRGQNARGVAGRGWQTVKGGLRKRWGLALSGWLCLCVLPACSGENPHPSGGGSLPTQYVVSPARLDPPPWPVWALRHWVWEDESTQESALDLVTGYLDNDIPVGAVIVDSPWETGYNTFVFDPVLYPDPEGMIRSFHGMGVRVFLWIVSMINEDSPNYSHASEQGFFVTNADGEAFRVEWWKGIGGMLDYTNPEAVAWWHGQMDRVLDWGIDGWKVDGTNFSGYILSLFRGGMFGKGGRIRPEDYSALYYSDFFHYTRDRLGPDRIITARPVDSYGTFVPLAFAPGDVNLAGWVGDQDPTFAGLRNALYNLFASSGLTFQSDKAYVNYGSDIGGYRGDGKRDKELFVRWTQLGAFCPIMENGGSGEHRPWMYDEETLALYRKFVCLHHQLIPYLYSQGAEAYEASRSLMVPVGSYALEGSRWLYMLGEALIVSAITEPGGRAIVDFPEGEWMDLFTGEVFPGGESREWVFPLDAYPAFLKRGALVPLEGVAACASCAFPVQEGVLTYLVWPGEQGSFRLHEEHGTGVEIVYERAGDELAWEISATGRPVHLLLKRSATVDSVRAEPTGLLPFVDGSDAWDRAATGWTLDRRTGDLRVKPGPADRGLRVFVRYGPQT